MKRQELINKCKELKIKNITFHFLLYYDKYFIYKKKFNFFINY
jgi:hypothetical protein